jgi:hypothetical protein
MNAYDYEKQKEVSGREGAEMRLSQLHRELVLLRSDKCDEYLKMIGLHAGHARAAIETCGRGITQCERCGAFVIGKIGDEQRADTNWKVCYGCYTEIRGW